MDKITTHRDMEEQLSEDLNRDVYKAETVSPDDLERTPTLLYAENDGQVEAYVVDGPVQTALAGDSDLVEEYGITGVETPSASANQYDSETADEVAAMLDADVVVHDGAVQRRSGQSTNVSLESEDRDGWIERTLEGPEHPMAD